METLDVVSKIDDHDHFRQDRLETPFVHTHCANAVKNSYKDSADVCDTFDGFYRNNREAVDRIYNTQFSLTHENDCYCIPRTSCPRTQTFKACQCVCLCLCKRIRVASFVLVLCCLILGNQLFNNAAWHLSPVKSSQLKLWKANVDGMEGPSMMMDQLSHKNLTFGSTSHVYDEIVPRSTNSSD